MRSFFLLQWYNDDLMLKTLMWLCSAGDVELLEGF